MATTKLSRSLICICLLLASSGALAQTHILAGLKLVKCRRRELWEKSRQITSVDDALRCIDNACAGSRTITKQKRGKCRVHATEGKGSANI